MKKPPFTAVPHEVIDVHLKDLTGSELKVLLVIIRATYGWHRDTQTLSLSQLAEKTGLSRGSCSDAAARLCELGLVVKSPNSSTDGGHAANTYETAFEDDPLFGQSSRVVGKSDYPARPVEQYKEERKQTLVEKTNVEESSPTPSSLDHSTVRAVLEKYLGRKLKKAERDSLYHLTIDECESGKEVSWAKLHGVIGEQTYPRVNNQRREFERPAYQKRQSEPWTATTAISVPLAWLKDQPYQAYLMCLGKTGKRIDPTKAANGFELYWPKDDVEKQRLACEDAEYLADSRADKPETVPNPEDHLKSGPWNVLRRRIVQQARPLSKSEQANLDARRMLGLK